MDYIQFIYLNPQIVYENELYDVEQAKTFWNSNSNTYSNIPLNQSYLPDGFNSYRFAIDNREFINFGELNFYIFKDLSQSFTPVEIDKQAQFFPSIYKPISNVTSNIYTPNYGLTSNDTVKILSTDGTEYISNILSINESNFQLSLEIPNADILYGIKLYDVDRIGKIEYYRFNILSNQTYTPSNFNIDLYRLLYPSTIQLSEEESYFDYIYNNRIGSVEDIKSLNSNATLVDYYAPSNNFDNIVINNTSVHYITNNPYNIGVSSNTPGLITEYAIKQYVDNSIETQNNTAFSTSNSNFTISNLNVSNINYLTQDITFDKDVFIKANLQVDEKLYNFGGIGIGFGNPSYTLSNQNASNSDSIVNNIHVTDTSYVGETAQVDGNVLCSKNISAKGNIFSGRFGIGEVIFDTLNGNALDNTYFNDFIASENNLYVEESLFANIIYNNQFKTKTIYMPYVQAIQENLTYISSKIGYDMDISYIQNAENDVLKIKRSFTVLNNYNIEMNYKLYGIQVGDVIVTSNKMYYVTALQETYITVNDRIPYNVIDISEIRLLDRQYFDISKLVLELTNQIKVLSSKIV